MWKLDTNVDEIKFMSCMIVELHKNPCAHSLMSETHAFFKQKFDDIHSCVKYRFPCILRSRVCYSGGMWCSLHQAKGPYADIMFFTMLMINIGE